MKTLNKIVMMAALMPTLAQTVLAQTADEVAEKYLTAIGGQGGVRKDQVAAVVKA